MPQKTETQKRLEKLRQAKWNKEEKPYYRECLSCSLSCEQLIRYRETSYNILTCPKTHKGSPMFPYKYAEMKKEYDKREMNRIEQEG